MVEGEALTLVDGDGPGQAERELPELALHLGFYLAGLVVDFIAHVLPLEGRHLDGLRIAGTEHADVGAVQVGDTPYAAVVEEMVGRGIVLHEHHLGAHLQLKAVARGVGVLRKSALHLGCVGERGGGELAQLGLVAVVGQPVVGGEPYVALLGAGGKGRLAAAVEQGQFALGGLPAAHHIEQLQEVGILLPVHGLQLDGHIVHLRKGLGAEEVGSLIIGVEQSLLLGGHHRGELLQVANHEQLHTAEGHMVVAEPAQHGVDGVEQVAPHHRYLVDDEQVERGDEAPFLTTVLEAVFYLSIGHIGGEGQLEKGVDGDTAGIDGRHTGGRHHHGALAQALHHRFQKGGLAGAGLAGEEDALASVFHEVPRGAQFFVFLHTALGFVVSAAKIRFLFQ